MATGPTVMPPIDWNEVATTAYAAYAASMGAVSSISGKLLVEYKELPAATQAAWLAAAKAVGTALNYRK